MDNQILVSDVLIIGGGPAGSTTATQLARRGHKVTLLEKEKFPRDHVGESLLPFCYALFKDLGLLEALKGRFVRKPGVRFIDIDGAQRTTWCFNRVIKDESFLSFQVVRDEFDQILLENSRKHGADVREQTRVVDVDLENPDGHVDVKAVGPDGETRHYRARFLVDASGRNSFIATKKGWRKSIEGLDRTAIWTHWTVSKLSGGLEEGLSLIVYLGGEKKGWIWIFPLGLDRLTVGVVLNNQYIREQKAMFEARGSSDWQMDLYRQELGYSPFVCNVLQYGDVNSPLRIEGNYSYLIEKENKFGPTYALIGDASTFIDPIFSSGVFLSMKGSTLLAEALHEKLTNPEPAGMEAIAQAYKKIDNAYGIVRQLIASFYNPQAITWAEAGAAAVKEHLIHENAMASGHYLLSGDFFERGEVYTKFLDKLQEDRTYRRFKKTVIDRREYLADTCDAGGIKIFPSGDNQEK